MWSFSKPAVTWTMVLVGIFAAILWDVLPSGNGPSRFRDLPLHGTRFRMRNVPLTETEKATFGGAEVVKRLIRCEGQPAILLTVVDGGKNNHAIHDPTYCLRGAGWTIVAENPLPIPGGTARWVRLKQRLAGADREIEAVYWFSNGRQCYDSSLRSWADGVLARVSRHRVGPSPALVLMHSLGQEEQYPDWEAILRSLPALSRR
ncbi:MAG: exosortase-associated EpsI family protein [Capsulimonadales bacterium]|nr:exosortase-associated EpsI family protein [Capsulimonadales bacterium]